MNQTLHFCWLVDPWKSSREQYLQAWQAAGWRCVLWHSGQIEEAPVPGVELRNAAEIVQGTIIQKSYEYELNHNSHASCADLFRYQVLYTLGGAYADIDVLPGKGTTPELPAGPLFGLAERNRFEIRFIRTPAKHPLLMEILKRVARNQLFFMRQGGYSGGFKNIVERTGPIAARSVVIEHAKNRLADFVLPHATIDDTKENRSEGHGLRIAEILSKAKHPVWGGGANWGRSLRWRK